LARKVVQNLPESSDVLEVAPGPGYFAVEIAKLGNYQVTGLDISKPMVEIAQNYAIEEETTATFHQGNASNMPFDDESFDFIVCSAAFKNFSDPVGAIQEMYRVLRPKGKALIADLRKDAPNNMIYKYVDNRMIELRLIDRLFVKYTLIWLKKRAYTKKDIELFVSKTNFGKCKIVDTSLGIEMEIWLNKP
jgi:ubiquinone/menaquinone biosynthesis C-methylase UbiE